MLNLGFDSMVTDYYYDSLLCINIHQMNSNIIVRVVFLQILQIY